MESNKSKSEIRHEKQKKKLLDKKINNEIGLPARTDENPKMKIYNEALSLNYECTLENGSILMFKQENKEAVINWLQEKYAKDENGVLKIPFSYGFH